MATKLKAVAEKPTRIMELGAELAQQCIEQGKWDRETPAEPKGRFSMADYARWRRPRAMMDLAQERCDAIVEMISVLPAESLADAAVQLMLAKSIGDTMQDKPCHEVYAREKKRQLDRLMGSAIPFIEGAAGINLMEYGARHYSAPWANPMDPYNPAYEDDFVGDDA